jgi:Domain of unknown function (DUF4288)
MARKSKIPFRNRNQTGWWIYSEVLQQISGRQKKLLPTSRCLIWENLRLVRAKNREEAYRKAVKWSRIVPSKNNHDEWRFAGISMLLPVYEDFEDGSELLWQNARKLSVKQIKNLVKSKQQLSVFDDKP